LKKFSVGYISLGLLAAVVATLTATHVVPSFLDASSGFSTTFLTTVFWTCVSGLFMLAALAYSILANARDNRDPEKS
jgi:hypothetical protein